MNDDERMVNMRRWRDLAPGECRVEVGQYGTQVWVKLGGAFRFQDDPRTEMDKAIQLAALTVAIRARNWHWRLDSGETEEGYYHRGTIFRNPAAYALQDGEDGKAAEPCNALLAGYLLALTEDAGDIQE